MLSLVTCSFAKAVTHLILFLFRCAVQEGVWWKPRDYSPPREEGIPTESECGADGLPYWRAGRMGDFIWGPGGGTSYWNTVGSRGRTPCVHHEGLWQCHTLPEVSPCPPWSTASLSKCWFNSLMCQAVLRTPGLWLLSIQACLLTALFMADFGFGLHRPHPSAEDVSSSGGHGSSLSTCARAPNRLWAGH